MTLAITNLDRVEGEGSGREKQERRRELGRLRSAKFYQRNQFALQKKAYLYCLEKGIIKLVRPRTALKYGLMPRSENQEIEVF